MSLKMLGFVFFWFCSVCFLQIFLIHCDENSTVPEDQTFRSVDRLLSPSVLRLLVPEDHHLCLRCTSSDGSDVVWTHQDKEVQVTLGGNYGTHREERRRYRVLSDGALSLLQLDDSDSGQYRCNGQLVAELQVLKGQHFVVYAGWTLLLPCGPYYKPKQRWFHRRRGGRREPIFSRFKNGTVKPEREGARLSFAHNALQILNLQPEDAGEYQCGEMQVRVSVLAEPLEPTSIQSPCSTAALLADRTTDVVNVKKKDTKRFESALLVVAVVGLVVMILLLASVCVLLTNMRWRRKKKRRHAAHRPEDTELQPWTSSGEQTDYEVIESRSQPEEIHYASLGRQNWGERSNRTPSDPVHHGVIYSSVITRPAVR